MSRVVRACRLMLVSAAILVTPPAVYAGYLGATGNVHVVAKGQLYRAGQMGSEELADLIQRHHIRTVINLRGAHPEEAWYRAEAAAVEDAGAGYVSIALSSRSQPEPATLSLITRVLRDSPTPILVHCKGGADRTGLVAAMFQLAVAGEPKEEAAEELSIAYGHIPSLFPRTAAMDRAFDAFATNWAADTGHALASLD